MQRIAITGSSGYLGGKLIGALRQSIPNAQILGLDVRPSKGVAPDQFVEADIRDPKVVEGTRAFKPDTIIHSAFAFQPQHDDRLMHSINIDGCQNVLRAAAEFAPQRLHILSSATAFGAWPDNPVPIHDDYPARGRPEFRYSADKAEIETMLVDFAKAHPAIAVSWVRPAVVMGPKMDNYLTRFMFGMPFLARLDGQETTMQFVHEDDVTAAILAILKNDGRGGYNVGPPDWITITELAQVTGRRCISLPLWLSRFAAATAWFVRLPIHEFPASFLYFARYPWVVSPDRLRDELGFSFQYSTRQTLDDYLEKKRQQAETRAP